MKRQEDKKGDLWGRTKYFVLQYPKILTDTPSENMTEEKKKCVRCGNEDDICEDKFNLCVECFNFINPVLIRNLDEKERQIRCNNIENCRGDELDKIRAITKYKNE